MTRSCWLQQSSCILGQFCPTDKGKAESTAPLSCGSRGLYCCAEAGNFCLLKKKEKARKKRYYGVKCNSVEMPRLLFSEEAV